MIISNNHPIDLAFIFDEDVNGYTTNEVDLTGDVYLTAKLKDVGLMVIRHGNEGKWPIVLASDPADDFQIRIFGETNGTQIKIETSVEPEWVKLTKI